MSWPSCLRLVAFCCALAAGSAAGQPGAPSYSEPSQDIERLLSLVEARLALMEQVAAFKQANRQPLEDPARETELISTLLAQGDRLGLTRGGLRPFLELQIEWARTAQSVWQERWKTGRAQPPNAVRDLSKEIRPELDRIGREMVLSAYLAAPVFAAADQIAGMRPQTVAALRSLPEPDQAADTLLARLRAIRTAPTPVLERVRAAGVLRIGTTGDYAPFSSDAGGSLTGIDIALGQRLAASLTVTPRFVRTSWPTLSEDLSAGRFDIALSGITVTDARRRIGEFSTPYHDGGKASIARCPDVERFDTVGEINQPSTRAIVNPGGTNERFARENLQRATLTVHPDNRTIFDEIVAGRADVMVTDDIEVALVTRREPRLCRASPIVFTRDDKAVFMPKDPPLQQRVNRWLDEVRSQGVLTSLFAEALR